MAMATGTRLKPPSDRRTSRSIGKQGFKAAVGLVAAGLLIWFVLAVTFAGVFRTRVPDLALALAPFDARANAEAGQRLLMVAEGVAGAGAAQAKAVQALRRDPTVVDAVTTVGVAAAMRSRPAQAERSFGYASRLSKRDIPTQLWLIEHNVQRGNIAGALVHFDIALRTSPGIGATLFPVLVNASSEPAIAVELNKLLRSTPNWAPDFISVLLTGQSDPTALYNVTRGLLQPVDAREREQLTYLVGRLVELNAFDLAWRAYSTARPGRKDAASQLRNGDFSSEPDQSPFDWDFPDDAALMPERRPRGSGNAYALYLPPSATRDVEVARQLVRLESGRYAVSALVGEVSGDAAVRPRLTVSCASPPQSKLAEANFPVAPEQGRKLSLNFAVPAGCRYQWISLWVRGTYDPQDSGAPWIGSVQIREL
jgi:hypothetical protein